MTKIYLIRHAMPDFQVHDDATRPLNAQGQKDTALVTAYLMDKQIDAVISSPYLRTVDTVKPFADAMNLPIRTIDDFRERKITDAWINAFDDFAERQWADFSYKLENGECLAEVQQRNIAALEMVLDEYKNKNIVIGTHGTAMSTIIHHYDPTYGYEGFKSMMRIFPWVCVLVFDGKNCVSIEKVDLFQPR